MSVLEGDDAVFEVGVGAPRAGRLVVALGVEASPVGGLVDAAGVPVVAFGSADADCSAPVDPDAVEAVVCGVGAVFAAGDVRAFFRVPTVEDAVVEPDGRVSVRVLVGGGFGGDYVVGSPGEASVVVRDDDVPEVSVTAGSGAVSEGGDAVFEVLLDQAPVTDVEVGLRVSERGVFAAGGGLGRRSVVVAAGDTSARLVVGTVDDAVVEPDGAVSAAVLAGSGYVVGSPGSASVSVRDDDVPAVSVTAGSGAVSEGGDAVFVVLLDQAPLTDVAVGLVVSESGVFAAAGGLGRRSVVVAAGDTSARLVVGTVDDAVDEADGEVSVAVLAGSGYRVGSPGSASVSVRDDEVPKVTVTAGSKMVSEGAAAVFVFAVSMPPAGDLVVTPAVTWAGDFADGDDLPGSVLTFGAGGPASVSYAVATVDDAVVERDGSVTVSVTDSAVVYADADFGGAAVAGDPSLATVAVTDDDNVAVTVTAGAAVSEGADAVFAVAADQAVLEDLSVRVGVAETGGGDFVAAADEGPASVVIPEGAATVEYRVRTVDDRVDEAHTGAVAVTVQSDPRADPRYSVGSPASAEVAVRDDDASAVTVTAGADVVEGADAVFTITAAAAPAAKLTVTVDVSQTGGVAAPGSLGAKTVEIPAGRTSVSYRVATVSNASTDNTGAAVTVTLNSVAGDDTGGGYAVADPKTATVAVADNGLAVTVAADTKEVAEGQPAPFTITATGPVAADLAVTVDVTATGGVVAAGDLGARTVTIAENAASAALAVPTLTLPAAGTKGTVTATITAVAGPIHAVGHPKTATVDVGEMKVTITAPNPSIQRRYDAVFTLTATNPAPKGGLKVTVDRAAAPAKDLRRHERGIGVYTIPEGQTTTDIKLDTYYFYDSGTIRVTVKDGSGYQVGTPNSATVTVGGQNSQERTLNCHRFRYVTHEVFYGIEGTTIYCSYTPAGDEIGSRWTMELIPDVPGGRTGAKATPGGSCATPGVDYAFNARDRSPGGTLSWLHPPEVEIDLCSDKVAEGAEIVSVQINVWVGATKRTRDAQFLMLDN